MRILIIDDVQLNRDIFKTILEPHKFTEIAEAENGRLALKLIRSRHPDEQFDLIITDISMPEMDGIELCRILKSTPAFEDIPVLIITGHTDDDILTQAFEAGVNDFIRQPLEPIELLARTGSALRLKQEIDSHRKKIEELREALAREKTLGGLLPICAGCKKIKDDKGYWKQVESYIEHHSHATFTHGICPACTEQLYGDFLRQQNEK
ncbi:MAG: response regulator [Bacteroidetes bacterium]|nr:response regulator [Bacteroidota bacterium]